MIESGLLYLNCNRGSNLAIEQLIIEEITNKFAIKMKIKIKAFAYKSRSAGYFTPRRVNKPCLKFAALNLI